MKRLLILLLMFLLTGCSADESAPELVTPQPSIQTPAPEVTAPEAVKTGLAVVANIAKSMHATPDFPGAARTEVTFVALTVDDEGVIRSCCIDGVSAILPFDATGALQSEEDVDFASKNELGEDYAMHKASSIGTEWQQQAAAFAAYAVGRRADELSAGDVTTSVTISTDSMVQAIQTAVDTAVHQGAQAEDRLVLSVLSHSDNSYSAGADSGTDGCAAFRTDVSAVTLRGDTVTSCRFDALETALTVTPEGRIADDLSAPQLSMTALSRASMLHDSYYTAQDWCRQADVFARSSVGQTRRQILESALPASTGSIDASFHALLYKAVQENR